MMLSLDSGLTLKTKAIQDNTNTLESKKEKDRDEASVPGGL